MSKRRRTKTPIPEKEEVSGGEEAMDTSEMLQSSNNHISHGDEEEDDLLNMVIPPMVEPEMRSDGTGERLVIASIDVENFKSYFERQTIGPLHKNFTAIIGPNGSGKSNVIDAILFVLGFKAKSIRSKKLSTLIHNSQGKTDISHCIVRINFAKIIDIDEVNFDVVSGSEFSVARFAYKDNSTKYEYNGKVKPYNEVHRLLKAKGIDLEHNRFLILQGEVETLSLMKPIGEKPGEEGMLEYLEDIIGSSRLKEPIEKLYKGIQEVTKARNMFLTRFNIIEEEKEQLEKGARECINFMKTENARGFLYNLIQNASLIKLSEKKVEIKGEKEALEKLVSECKVALDEVLAQQASENSNRGKLQKAVDKIRKEGDSLSNKLLSQKEVAVKAEADITRSTEKSKELESSVKKEEKKVSNLEAVPDECDEKIVQLQDTIASCESVISEKGQIVNECMIRFEQATTEFGDRLKEPESKVNDLLACQNAVAKEVGRAEQSLKELVDADKAGLEDLTRIRGLIAKDQAAMDAKKDRLVKVQDSLPSMEAESKTLEKELATLDKEFGVLEPKIATLKGKKASLGNAIGDQQSQNRIATALMSFKHTNKIKGIIGRLGDLGGIDPKYDYAITAAARGTLDNIVVDTMETAEVCIDFMRKTKAGRAAFMVMEKIGLDKLMKASEPKEIPEGAQRLFDLIECKDANIKCCFYFAVRDTLVCEGIENANRIAFKSGQRWRVVTTNGELIEQTGVICGGGKKPDGGKMGKKAVISGDSQGEKEELARVSAELEEHLGRFRDLAREMSDGRVKLQKMTGEIEKLKAEQEELTQYIRSMVEIIAVLNQQEAEKLGQLSQKLDNKREIADLTEKVVKAQMKLSKAQAATDKAKEVVKEITDERDGLYDSIVGVHEIPLKEAKKTKTDSAKLIKTEQTKKSNALLNMKKSQQNLNKLKAEIDEHRNRVEECSDIIDKNFKAIFNIETQIEANKAEEVTAKEALAAVTEANGELNAKETALRDQLLEQTENCDAKKGEYVMVKQGIQQCAQKINDIKTNDISDTVFASKNKKTHAVDFLFEAGIDDKNPKQLIIDDFGELCVSLPGLEECLASGVISTYTKEEMEQFDMDDVEAKLKVVDVRLKQSKKVQTRVLDDFRRVLKKFNTESIKLEKMNDKVKKYSELHDNLRRQRLVEFLNGYTQILLQLKLIYQMLTLGGEANLELVNSMDPFDKGIRFSVRPPLKTWREMSRLSGGEKTLSSLALVFALHKFRPTPFYVMDEIDAALDFKNVTIIAHFVMKQTKNAQFIIITLRNNMFELADRIVGICKTSDCTKNIVIDPPALGVQ